jgi:hypothetical protein
LRRLRAWGTLARHVDRSYRRERSRDIVARAVVSSSMKDNPVVLDADELHDILEQASS